MMIDPILIDIPMPIITPRLIIRPVQDEDIQDIYNAKKESYDELRKWRILVPENLEEMTSENHLKFMRQKQSMFFLRQDIMLYAYEKNNKKFIGGTGIHDPDWKLKLFRTGYWVRTSETGKGYATEMAIAMARYAFLILGAHKLSLTHAEGNDMSAKVIKKVGYEKEGVLKKCHQVINNKLVDEYHYGLLGLGSVPDMDVMWGVQ